jgi:PAS domain S-box-containing protein
MISELELTALREKAQLLQLVQDATQDGIVDWDVRSGLVGYNPRWKHMLGFDDASAPEYSETDNLWRELIHADDRPRLERVLQDHFEHDWPFTVTTRMRHRYGGFRHILCRGSALRDEDGQPLRMLITFADIDYQVRTEERQRALARAIPDTLFRLDALGTFVSLKPGTEREGSPFLAIREGRTVSECLPDGQLRSALEGLLASAASPGDASLPQLLQIAGGSPLKPSFFELRLVRCDGGECVCIARDVTDQRVMEERLLQSQKLESIGQLAAGVAHEINTPMQFIGDNLHFATSSIADLLKLIDALKQKLEASLSPEVREQVLAEVAELEADLDLDYARAELPSAIDRSLVGVERVTTIVRAMKSFSHPGSNTLEPASLAGLLESTVTVSANEWRYLADLTLELDPELPPVLCLPSELNQVFLNLIVNAAHAIGDVVGTSGEKGCITITTSFDPTHAEVRIKDSGTGIPEHARAKVFDPFFTTKEIGKGTGQGLSMAYRCITERHNGTIAFETASGQGTTFVVRLPLAPPASATSESAA